MTKAPVVSPFVCWRCDKRLAESAGLGTHIVCRHCHATNKVPEDLEVGRAVDNPHGESRESE